MMGEFNSSAKLSQQGNEINSERKRHPVAKCMRKFKLNFGKEFYDNFRLFIYNL